MLLLGLDTATRRIGVVLANEHGMLGRVELGGTADTSPPRHAETLAPAIAWCCEQCGVDLAQLSAVAVGIGPGMFTGLRVGVTTAKVLAQSLRIPVIPIPSLDLLAYPLRHSRRPRGRDDRRPAPRALLGDLPARAGRRAARLRVRPRHARRSRRRARGPGRGHVGVRRRVAAVRRRLRAARAARRARRPRARVAEPQRPGRAGRGALRTGGLRRARRRCCRCTCAKATPSWRGTTGKRDGGGTRDRRRRSAHRADAAPASPQRRADRVAGVPAPVVALAVRERARAAFVALVRRWPRSAATSWATQA